ncbi:MAG: haloacid dehalogenase, type [Betaproteobacteria bacterium]|nr:haloacid dehalogenase, type [Betaproteobacteria bacterium]
MGHGLKAIVFDAYGTLFDVHSVTALCDRLFPGDGAALSRLWRAKQLEYTWLRSLMNRYEDFTAVTQAALAHACEVLALPLDKAIAAQLMSAYDNLALFPDARNTLAGLSGHQLAILSNGSPPMLGRLIANSELRSTFTAVISVDALQTYKPHPSVYQLAPAQLGLAKDEIGFVSSNYWDAAGAKNFGFTVFWINRAGVNADALGVTPDHVLKTLIELRTHLT